MKYKYIQKPNHKKLSDVCDIFSGGTPSTFNKKFWNGDIHWLSSGETRNNFITNTERKITLSGIENSSTRLAKKYDVIVASAGQGNTRGQVSLCLIDTYVNQSIIVLRTNNDIILPLFLFYNLKSRYDELRRLSDSHSSRGSLPKNVLSVVDVILPSLLDQEKIGKILYDLDLKIQNLQKQNKILEEIAQSIFKSWFVNFDGITKWDDSELGRIPKGWDRTDLKSVLSLRKDGSHNPPKRVDSGIRFIAGATDVKHFVINFTKCSYITKNDYKEIHKTWEVKTNDILLTIVGTIGNVAIVNENDLPFSLQRSLAVLRPNEKIDFSFLYFLLNSIKFEQFLYANLNPTGQPGIYLGTLGGFEFVLPPKPLIEKFFEFSEKIIGIIQKNHTQINQLSKIQDILLPKLMSGELRV